MIKIQSAITVGFCCFVIVTAFLDDGGFDPNAINGFPPGPFNPNAGISTIPTPAISGGGGSGSGGSGFNPNAGQATTIPPPTFNGFTGWSGSGNFNPNGGYTTSDPYGGGSFGGGWGFGGNGRKAPKSGSTTRSPFSNFGNNYWGFGTGAGGFNPNAGFTTKMFPTIHPTTVTVPTIHPTTPPHVTSTIHGLISTNGYGLSSTVAPSKIRSLPMTSGNVKATFGILSTLLTPTTTAATIPPSSDDTKNFKNIAIIG